jgi:hypothetical protein
MPEGPGRISPVTEKTIARLEPPELQLTSLEMERKHRLYFFYVVIVKRLAERQV